jgi:hypothetical protein
MTYMQSLKSHRLTSHKWLGLNPQIGRPLSRIVGAIGLFCFFILLVYEDFLFKPKKFEFLPCNKQNAI